MLISSGITFPKKYSVLIVDDSMMMAGHARRILEKDYLINTVSSGEECLDFVKSPHPHLILLDVTMKGMDGFDVLHALKGNPETADIPVIFLTSDEHNETEIRGLQNGAIDFISKPFIPDVLRQRVKNTIELTVLQQNLKLEVQKKTAKVRHLTYEITQALSSTVDAKDHYTRGHSARVAKYSAEIARRMGKNEEQQEEIYFMGLLHDIGKIGVAGSIIRKNSKLTEDEFEDIKEHPITGYNILKTIKSLPGLAIGARWHHEKFDGTGYPDHLKGYDIPEDARIIAVADVYDALSSKRSYSEIRPQSVVRDIIEKGKGTHFDPAIADIMLQMIDDDKNYEMKEEVEEE